MLRELKKTYYTKVQNTTNHKTLFQRYPMPMDYEPSQCFTFMVIEMAMAFSMNGK
jgi:hypothetical protein